MAGDPAVAGGLVGALAAEASGEESGVDLNDDGDTGDQVLHLYDATKKKVINTELEAADFVMGERATSACGDVQLTALRVWEVSQGDADLNGDGDTFDQVMAVHDAVPASRGSSASSGAVRIPGLRPPRPTASRDRRSRSPQADRAARTSSGEAHRASCAGLRLAATSTVIARSTSGRHRRHQEVETSTIAPSSRRCDGGGTPGDSECVQGEFCELDRYEVGFDVRAPHLDRVRGRRRLPSLHLRVPGSCRADATVRRHDLRRSS
jgi:hypothetical protein